MNTLGKACVGREFTAELDRQKNELEDGSRSAK